MSFILKYPLGRQHLEIYFYHNVFNFKVLINNDFLKHKHDDAETSAFNVNIRLFMYLILRVNLMVKFFFTFFNI